MMKVSNFRKKAYFWITLVLFMLSLSAHWYFSWKAYLSDQAEHHQSPQVHEFFVMAMRDTMENWQSEFLQLIWQVVGLSFLWYVGSPASKEGDERKEAKLDQLLRIADAKGAEAFLKELEEKYPKK